MLPGRSCRQPAAASIWSSAAISRTLLSVPTSKRLRPLSIFCLVGVGAGVLLIVAGAVWSTLDAGRMMYSPEQAKEWEQAGAAFHSATSGHAPDGSKLPGTPEEREKLISAARQ